MVNIENIEMEFCNDGAMPLISALCDKIGITKYIDDKCGNYKNNKVSTGNSIKAMIMNIITRRKPLYKLKEAYAMVDTDRLFGEGIKSENLNDDTLGRALDELYELGPKKVFTELAMLAISKFNIKVSSIHADTTSKTLYGAYGQCDDDEDVIQVKRGHGKDFRPDLKQILFGDRKSTRLNSSH